MTAISRETGKFWKLGSNLSPLTSYAWMLTQKENLKLADSDERRNELEKVKNFAIQSKIYQSLLGKLKFEGLRSHGHFD